MPQNADFTKKSAKLKYEFRRFVKRPLQNNNAVMGRGEKGHGYFLEQITLL